jgi:glycolate oxidase
MQYSRLASQIRKIVGKDAVLDRPEDLMLYEYDGGVDRGTPNIICFPQTTEHVSKIMHLATKAGVPIVPRGAGTGLSGGSIARNGGIVLGFSRMNKILEIDIANQRAVVQPGVVNLDLTHAVEAKGFYFAPDPSSQKACTIGGNVAENSGGPHTLANGVTVNHVTGLEVVMPDGRVVELGSKSNDNCGYDLTGFFVGSEGTLGIATKITVRLTRLPEAVATLLAVFNTIDDAANSVVAITAASITPAALEMLDGWTLRTVEAATPAGYPLDCAAVLLIELEGLREAVDENAEIVRDLCMKVGAREVRKAADEAERQRLWSGRKNAFGAVGRISPSYYVQDGVIPRTKIPATLRHIEDISKKYNLQIGNIFHAGDGNLHPLILFDPRDADQTQRTIAAGREILEYCVSVGGSITGEHGVGMEKMDVMQVMFSDDDIDVMTRLRNLFNPASILNPQKVLPTTRSCRETFTPGHPSLGDHGPAATGHGAD